MHILQVSTADIGGGAEKVAWNLFQTYRDQGNFSRLAVGFKRTNDPDVFSICPKAAAGGWTEFWTEFSRSLESASHRVQGLGLWRLSGITRGLAQPGKSWDRWRGIENFRHPRTWDLLKQTSPVPDIVHCHNLHHDYFDLRILPAFSHRVPLVLTLHDAWLLSGHCAHSFDCERWKSGCGSCPDLTIYPAIQNDGTRYNWRRKQRIYRHSQLYVSTPSRWLMKKVDQSILADGIVESRVIPNGVDLNTFYPNRQSAKKALGLPAATPMILFTGYGTKTNIWKDYATLRAALARVAESANTRECLFIALGEQSPAEQIGRVNLSFIPFEKDPAIVAQYYQAADIYVHAAKVDTFPNAVLEALACGTPVVATAVGGIPEQLIDGVTGFLAEVSDSVGLASRLEQLLQDKMLRQQMSDEAAAVARKRFDLVRQATDYLSWYEEIRERWTSKNSLAKRTSGRKSSLHRQVAGKTN